MKKLSAAQQRMLDTLIDGERIRLFIGVWNGNAFAAVDRSGVGHFQFRTANALLKLGYIIDTGKRMNSDATTSGKNSVKVCRVKKSL